MILVSKCLAGEPCRYDGGDNLVPEIRALVERGEAIAVCPEVLGGLPTPRTPSESVCKRYNITPSKATRMEYDFVTRVAESEFYLLRAGAM